MVLANPNPQSLLYNHYKATPFATQSKDLADCLSTAQPNKGNPKKDATNRLGKRHRQAAVGLPSRPSAAARPSAKAQGPRSGGKTPSLELVWLKVVALSLIASAL